MQSTTMHGRKVEYRLLDTKVMAVAIEGGCGDWAAYVGYSEGLDRGAEAQAIRLDGSKLQKEVAKVLFPSFKDLKWRY